MFGQPILEDILEDTVQTIIVNKNVHRVPVLLKILVYYYCVRTRLVLPVVSTLFNDYALHN